jgi:intein-encoded DNA endonuclease-like protein
MKMKKTKLKYIVETYFSLRSGSIASSAPRSHIPSKSLSRLEENLKKSPQYILIWFSSFSYRTPSDIVKLYGLSSQAEQIGYEIAPPELKNRGCDGLFYYHFKMP